MDRADGVGLLVLEGELADVAVDLRELGRRRALKVLRADHADNPDVLERFVEEAQVEGQLQHPGVVPVYGLGMQPDGRPCFAMKLVRGETLAALGSCCGVGDGVAVSKGHELCNAYGIDTISGGCVVAFAMECYENGILTKADTDGIELTWGNHKAIVDMTWKLEKREGESKDAFRKRMLKVSSRKLLQLQKRLAQPAAGKK